MTLLSWKFRGLGQPQTVQELVRLVHTFKPMLVFLSDTRQSNEYLNKMRWRLGLRHCIMYAGTGKSVSNALFYDESVEIKKLADGPRYIDVFIRLNPHGLQWRGNFVYGDPKSHERYHMWNLFRRISTNATEP